MEVRVGRRIANACNDHKCNILYFSHGFNIKMCINASPSTNELDSQFD